MPANEKLLEVAIKSSIEAGNSIMKIYKKDFKIETKDDASPLTEADLASNKVIMSYLEKTNIPIISEENKSIDYDQRKEWESCWIVDPLDGTKEFIKRNGEFTVNIALIEKNKPVLGVIYVPASQELYFANVDAGKAFKTNINESSGLEAILAQADEIKPSKNSGAKVKVVGSRSHMNEDTLSYIRSLESEGKTTEIVSKGSSLKFCLVAEGKADVYPRFAPTMEWDTAAGQAICNAVGLRVMDQDTGSEMKYNRENLLNNYFLVTK
nr:3'(2'),5'-bisphosphate nucleotidase CysQ [Robertkochia sp. 3YJGBD-33]